MQTNKYASQHRWRIAHALPVEKIIISLHLKRLYKQLIHLPFDLIAWKKH